MERHLWLSLMEMQDWDSSVLLNSLMSPSGLFCGTVRTVVGRFQEASKQAAAFKHYLLHRHRVGGAAILGQPQQSSSYRTAQTHSVATHTPMEASQHRSWLGTSRATDLQIVIWNRRAGAKRP